MSTTVWPGCKSKSRTMQVSSVEAAIFDSDASHDWFVFTKLFPRLESARAGTPSVNNTCQN